MSVREYDLKFTQPSRYFPNIVVDMRKKMSLFVNKLSRLSIKEGKIVMLVRGMDITRLITNFQQVEEDELKDREEFRYKKVMSSINLRPIMGIDHSFRKKTIWACFIFS